MILKKPYAFLIKNFRIIHIILTGLIIYITYKGGALVTFFSDFVKNDYGVTVTSNLAKSYVGWFLGITIVLVIVFLIAIYVLLRTKKKPSKFYLFSIIYYIILLIGVIVSYFLIASLSTGLWTTTAARMYRDLSRIIYYPQFIILIIIAIRALGFNVKQFNFKSDLRELEITEADSEEIELNLNFDNYKFKRTIRRFIREFKYYVKENKMVIIAIGIALVLILGYLGYKNYEKTNYNYKENESFISDNLSFKITGSMVTNLDQNGNILYKDKYFVVIRFEVTNNSRYDLELDYNNFKLYYDDNFVYPSLDLGTYFKDFGDPYEGYIIKTRDSTSYIMPYMIDEKYKNKDFYIELYLGAANKKNDFVAKTARIKLSPAILDNVETIRNAQLNEVVSLSSTALNDSTIAINSAILTNRYEYNYQNCYKEECRTYTDVVVADNTYQQRQGLIVMDYSLSLDKTTSAYKNINNISSFASSFMQVEYKMGNDIKRVKAIYATPQKLKNKLILQTDGSVLSAEEVYLIITIRNRSYSIKLR